jgi:PhzF family phenazine biosynthesis protein
MKIRQFQVDAFTGHVFAGNPAAVCPLEQWPDDELLQRIAEENNLSETAFFVPAGDDFELRWFTPLREVDLCGHATLASAHALFRHLGYRRPVICFHTRSGPLSVTRDGNLLSMDFPAIPCEPCDAPDALVEGIGRKPVEVHCGSNYMAVLDDEAAVRSVQPDQGLLGQLDLHGVIITAPGNDADFVSRYFAPKFGIPEDPVTGSAHCQLAPWWAARLGRNRLHARQISRRGGELICRVSGDRVILSGEAVTFMSGEIAL